MATKENLTHQYKDKGITEDDINHLIQKYCKKNNNSNSNNSSSNSELISAPQLQLRELNLSNNHLESLPNNFSQLSSLTKLDLRFNSFESSFPVQVCSL